MNKFVVQIADLPPVIQADIHLFNEENPVYAKVIPVDGVMPLEDALEAWLGWNGILGFTNRIMNIIENSQPRGKS